LYARVSSFLPCSRKKYLLNVDEYLIILATFLHRIILSFVTCRALPCTSTLYRLERFSEQSVRNIKCMFLFCLQLLPVTFLSLKTIQQSTIVNVPRFSLQISTKQFSQHMFGKVKSIKSHENVSYVRRIFSCVPTDDGHAKANSLF